MKDLVISFSWKARGAMAHGLWPGQCRPSGQSPTSKVPIGSPNPDFSLVDIICLAPVDI